MDQGGVMIQVTKSKWALLFYPVVLCPQASVGLEGRDFSPGRPMARLTTATSVCYLPGPSRSNLHHPQSNRVQVGSYMGQADGVLSEGSFIQFPLPLWVSNKGPSPYFIACVMQPILIIENRVLTRQYFSPTSDATPVWSDLETEGFQQQRFFVTSSPVPRIIDSRSKSKLQQVNCYTWFSPIFVCIHVHIFRRIGGNTSAQQQNAKFRMFIRSSKQPKRKSRVSYYYYLATNFD